MICTLLVLPAPAQAQLLEGACFRVVPGDPVWRATETNPEPPRAARPFAEYFSGGAGAFRVVPHPEGYSPGFPVSYVEALDSSFFNPRFNHSDWRREGDSVVLTWSSGFDAHTAVLDSAESTESEWEGLLTWRSDARMVPDPGEWSYRISIEQIACPTAPA